MERPSGRISVGYCHLDCGQVCVPSVIPRHSVAYLFAIYVGSDAEIRANMFKSLLLNSLSLLSIYVFDLLLQPLVQDQQKWLHRNMGWFYSVLWLFPVVGASLYLNVS